MFPLTSQPRADAARPRLSAVVPCHNEEACLRELHRRLSAACRTVVGDNYELVFVDDGSGDRTWAIVLQLAAFDPHVVGVALTRNHGHQLALTAGLHVCRGQRALVIDADLQDPPELLGDMMRLMDEGAEVVYGQRVERSGESLFKRVTAAAFYRILNSLADVAIPLDAGDFRLISRRALDLLNAMPEHHRFVRGMVSWIGLRQVPLQYERDGRYAGTTKYPTSRMARLAVDAITSFSIKPLRLASYFGLVFAGLGFLALIYTFYSWAVWNAVAGWASVMSAVLVLGSIQLLMLGLYGEYLGRLYIEAKRRPLFMIDRIVRVEQGASAGDDDRNGLDLVRATALNEATTTVEPAGARPR